jgi:hypothetical protein
MILEAMAEMTSQATGTGKASMYRIQKEANANNNTLSSSKIIKISQKNFSMGKV